MPIKVLTDEYIGETLKIDTATDKVEVNIDNDTIKKDVNGILFVESPAVTVSMVAGEPLSGGMLVYINSSGTISKFNQSDVNLCDKALGFTNSSAVADERINVVKSGKCIEMGGLTPGAVYFADNNGSVTTIPPSIGIRQVVGTAESATILLVDIKDAFIKIE